jgi:hypothetical protein
MPDPRRTLRNSSAAELDRLAKYSESDKQRAREAARIDGGPRLRAMLGAKPKAQRAATSPSKRGLPRSGVKVGSILSQPGDK